MQNKKFLGCLVSLSLLPPLIFSCSKAEGGSGYSYKEISAIGRGVPRDEDYPLLTRYGVYHDDYKLNAFDAEIDGILKSKSLERVRKAFLGVDSAKASGSKALMTVRAIDKNGEISIIVFGYDWLTKKVSFVSKEDLSGIKELIKAPDAMIMNDGGFIASVSSGNDGMWRVDFQVRGHVKDTSGDFYGFASVFYSKDSFERIEARSTTGVMQDDVVKSGDVKYKIESTVDRSVGSSMETRVFLIGPETWNVSDALENCGEYKDIRKKHGDHLFKGLGFNWRFDHRWVVQDSELYIVASQSESEGGMITTRLTETDDFAFRVNVDNKTFEYVGATVRGSFCGILC